MAKVNVFAARYEDAARLLNGAIRDQRRSMVAYRRARLHQAWKDLYQEAGQEWPSLVMRERERRTGLTTS